MTVSRPAPILPLALLLTVLMTAWWTALAWADLGHLRLPEADAMVRLAQIRDWLDGQRFADLVQGRLGPLGGTAMHWSRLPDLVPGAIVILLSPLMGAARAEIAAVMFWPELLFFAHLLLAGAIARRLGGAPTVYIAVALAALAAPATDLFMPGRIDHHGLQIVLVEAMLLALLSRRMLLAGAAAGISLLVGIEAVPVMLAAMAVVAAGWAWRGRAIGGFGFGLLIAALAGFALLRPQPWLADRCDGFTPPVFAMMLIAGGAWLVLAGLTPRLPNRGWRVGAALVLAVLVAALGWAVAPSCFANPYGPGDPLLDTIWPQQIGELGGLLRQPPGALIGWLVLPLAALGTATSFALRTRGFAWALLAAAIGISVLAAFMQVRSLWFATALSAPVLAQLIQVASARGVAWRIGAWAVSIGLLWQAVAAAIPAPPVMASCADARTLAALDRLETGTFAAPMELGAALIGATQHRSLGGPYHRDVRGNRALADFFRETPDQARYQASLWTIDYVALCPADGGGLAPGLLIPSGLAAHLLGGAGPAWLDPIPLIGSDLLVWRVVRGMRP